MKSSRITKPSPTNPELQGSCFSASNFEEQFFNINQTYIDPSSIIGPQVTLGKNVKIGPFCIIIGKVTIGDNTIIFPHVSIGFPAQDTGTQKSLGSVVIGKNCNIRSFASVSASKYPNGKTTIGDNCYVGHGAILRGDYGRIVIGPGTAVEEGIIAHSPPGFTLEIGKSVTLGHGAVLHGKSIGDYAVIGMGSVLSLFSEVGEWAIVAEGAVVKMKQVIPGNVVVGGSPAEVVRETSLEDKEMWTHGKQIYVDLAKKYLDIGMHEV